MPQTVLCVDDDRLLLSLFCDALEAKGYRTAIATDGPSALETARGLRPDLILLDVVMPGMTGIEACRLLRAEPGLARTPILLLTASPDLALDAEARQAGATLLLRKPFGPGPVVAAIESLLGPPAPKRRGPSRPRRVVADSDGPKPGQ